MATRSGNRKGSLEGVLRTSGSSRVVVGGGDVCDLDGEGGEGGGGGEFCSVGNEECVASGEDLTHTFHICDHGNWFGLCCSNSSVIGGCGSGF
jgi:hypothetical protein